MESAVVVGSAVVGRPLSMGGRALGQSWWQGAGAGLRLEVISRARVTASEENWLQRSSKSEKVCSDAKAVRYRLRKDWMVSAESVEGNVAVERSVWMGEGQPAGVGEPVVRVEGRKEVGDGGSSTGKSSSNGSKKSSAAGQMRWGPRVGVVTGTSMRLGMEGIEDEKKGKTEVARVGVGRKDSGSQALERRLELRVVLMEQGRGD